MGKWLLLMLSAVTCFLLLPASSAFGVSSRASLIVKSSREGIGRNDQHLHLVPETTELVANAAATVAGDDSWQSVAKDIARNGGVLTATLLFGFAPYLEKAIIRQTKDIIRFEIREEFGELKTNLGNLKTDVGNLKTDVGNLKITVVVVPLMIAAAVVLVIWMMKTN